MNIARTLQSYTLVISADNSVHQKLDFKSIIGPTYTGFDQKIILLGKRVRKVFLREKLPYSVKE